MHVIINGLQDMSEVQRTQVSDTVEDLIRRLAEGIEISSLEAVIVTAHFGSEVLEFQRKMEVREGYTDDSKGTAFAKNIAYEKNGRLKNTIFIDENLILLLFSEESQRGIHYLHHELCHVYDDYMKAEMLGLAFVLRQRGDFQMVLKLHAEAIWSEYIAVRLSVGTMYSKCDLSVRFLLELINKVKEENQYDIDNYRSSNDVDALYGKVQLNSSFLLKIAATVYGYIHGLQLVLIVMI